MIQNYHHLGYKLKEVPDFFLFLSSSMFTIFSTSFSFAGFYTACCLLVIELFAYYGLVKQRVRYYKLIYLNPSLYCDGIGYFWVGSKFSGCYYVYSCCVVDY